MKGGLKAGDEQSVRFIVDESMLAAFEGHTVHRVLSTFHLVYYTELAVRRLIEPFLEEGEEAAGLEICLKHLAPTPVRDTVHVTARSKSIEGKRVICEISASNPSGAILSGTQTQVLIERGRLDGR